MKKPKTVFKVRAMTITKCLVTNKPAHNLKQCTSSYVSNPSQFSSIVKHTEASFVCQLTAKKKPTHTFIVLQDESPEDPFIKISGCSTRA